MENADEFDSECSEYVTFTPSVLQLDESGTARCSATERCIQVHYFRSVAAAARPDRAPDPRLHFIDNSV